MAVIKHTEFKIICDNCGGDVTEWTPGKNKADAVKYARREYNKPFKRGSQFCEECESADDMTELKSDYDHEAAKRFFANAKPVHFFDLINQRPKVD